MALKDAMRGLVLVFAVMFMLLVSMIVMEPKKESTKEDDTNE